MHMRRRFPTKKLLKSVQALLRFQSKRKSCLRKFPIIFAELERFSLWGDVVPEEFAYLKENGVSLRMFEIPEDKYSLIDDTVQTIAINHAKKTVRFVLVNGGDDRPLCSSCRSV